MKIIGSFFKMFFVLILGMGFGVVIVSAYHAFAFANQPQLIAPNAASRTATMATATSTPVAAPAELIIPSLNVDAPVMNVGTLANGDLGVPNDAIHVAWYKDGPRPGELGTAVIDGHLDTIHAPQAVFYNLGNLKPGDEVDVRTADGETIPFTVTAVKEYPYDASTTDIFSSTNGGSDLNLITCAGDWVPSIKLYNERLVVFTHRSDE